METTTFFYTTHTPYQWSSGPTIHRYDPDDNYAPIASLERAKELARAHAHPSYSDNCVVTTYGMEIAEKR